MEKNIIRELSVGQIVMFKTEINPYTSHKSYGVVIEASNKTIIKWFDTGRETPYAFNTIHRLIREGMLEIASEV